MCWPWHDEGMFLWGKLPRKFSCNVVIDNCAKKRLDKRRGKKQENARWEERGGGRVREKISKGRQFEMKKQSVQFFGKIFRLWISLCPSMSSYTSTRCEKIKKFGCPGGWWGVLCQLCGGRRHRYGARGDGRGLLSRDRGGQRIYSVRHRR